MFSFILRVLRIPSAESPSHQLPHTDPQGHHIRTITCLLASWPLGWGGGVIGAEAGGRGKGGQSPVAHEAGLRVWVSSTHKRAPKSGANSCQPGWGVMESGGGSLGFIAHSKQYAWGPAAPQGW